MAAKALIAEGARAAWGGKAPSTDGTVVGQVARVPYTADYFFFRKTND